MSAKIDIDEVREYLVNKSKPEFQSYIVNHLAGDFAVEIAEKIKSNDHFLECTLLLLKHIVTQTIHNKERFGEEIIGVKIARSRIKKFLNNEGLEFVKNDHKRKYQLDFRGFWNRRNLSLNKKGIMASEVVFGLAVKMNHRHTEELSEFVSSFRLAKTLIDFNTQMNRLYDWANKNDVWIVPPYK